MKWVSTPRVAEDGRPKKGMMCFGGWKCISIRIDLLGRRTSFVLQRDSAMLWKLSIWERSATTIVDALAQPDCGLHSSLV